MQTGDAVIEGRGRKPHIVNFRLLSIRVPLIGFIPVIRVFVLRDRMDGAGVPDGRHLRGSRKSAEGDATRYSMG